MPAVALERMVESAHQRHWVEQYHEETKGLLGWDQDQGRLWRGFHRHAVGVMLAYSFLVWREWQQRQERTRPGRPRRAFSPSAGSTSRVIAGGPSPGLRLTSARSRQGVAVARAHDRARAGPRLTNKVVLGLPGEVLEMSSGDAGLPGRSRLGRRPMKRERSVRATRSAQTPSEGVITSAEVRRQNRRKNRRSEAPPGR